MKNNFFSNDYDDPDSENPYLKKLEDENVELDVYINHKKRENISIYDEDLEEDIFPEEKGIANPDSDEDDYIIPDTHPPFEEEDEDNPENEESSEDIEWDDENYEDDFCNEEGD